MECASVRDKLGSYLDGELPAAEVRAVDEHVRACSTCAAELGRLKALLERLATARSAEAEARPPAGMWARIERWLAHSPGQRIGLGYW